MTVAARAQEPQVQTSQVLNDQLFTGPLNAISPALPKAGIIIVEPYAISTVNVGSFTSNGRSVGGNNLARTFTLSPFLEYGITDRLSIDAIPGLNYTWDNGTSSRGILASDTPIDLKYRFVDQVVNTPIPSFTLTAGLSFPSGPYDKLGSAIEATGTGVYYARQGESLQWLFSAFGNHALRIRLWGELEEPLNSPKVQGYSAYGTTPGFFGNVNPGFNATVGISPEFGLTKRWVLAADFFRTVSNGARVEGTQNGVFSNVAESSSGSWVMAPAVEYNFSPTVGVIAGVQFDFAGHNASRYVEPQVAVNLVF